MRKTCRRGRRFPRGLPGGPRGAPLTAPGGWNPYPPGMPEEDEINLLDLFIVLLKHKVMIFSVVFLAGVAALVISVQMPNVYRSEATIAPTTQEKSGGGLAALGGFGAMIAAEVGIGATGSLDQFDVVLKSRDLTNTIIREHNLLPVIFEKSWDAKTGDWKVGEPPHPSKRHPRPYWECYAQRPTRRKRRSRKIRPSRTHTSPSRACSV